MGFGTLFGPILSTNSENYFNTYSFDRIFSYLSFYLPVGILILSATVM